MLIAVAFAACLSLVLLRSGHLQLALLASLAIFTLGLGVSAPRVARMTAFVALVVVQFVIVVPFALPTEYNYFAYATLLALGVLVAVSVVRPLRLSVTALFFSYLLTSAVLYLGAGQIRPQYQVFMYPLMAVCYHELALHADRREIRVVLIGFLAFAGIEAALGVMQSFYGWPLFFWQEALSSPRNPLAYLVSSISPMANQGLGTYDHFNRLGSLLALTFPIAFGLARQRRGAVRWVYLGLIGAGLFATYSRSAWLGSIVGTAAILLATGSWRRRLGVALTAGLLATLLLTFGSSIASSYYDDTQNVTARVASWQIAVTDLRAQPDKAVFGFGYSFYIETASGNNETASTSFAPESKAMSMLHSWPLQALLELGVVGLVLLLICVLPPPLHALRLNSGSLQIALAGGILGFLTSQLFENSLFGATGVFMFLLLGVLRRLQQKESRVLTGGSRAP